MKEYIDNILNSIELLLENKEYKYNILDIDKMKSIVLEIKNSLEKDNNILLLDIKKIKLLSNMVYDLNINNSFSKITETISNDLYAFEFILEEN